MLRTMRENMKSLSLVLWIIVLAFIGTIFLVWGRGSQRGGKDVVVKVGGRAVTYMEYKKAYVRDYEFYRRLFKSKFDEAMAKKLKLKEQVLDRLINEKMLEEVADRMGIKVFPREVTDEIVAMEVFKVNGRFDPKKYQKVLQRNRRTPAEFEGSVRSSLLKDKLLSLVKDSVRVSDAEVRDLFLYGSEKVKIRYVELTPGVFASMVKVTPQEIAKYYGEHKEKYRVPDTMKVAYLPFTISDFKRRVRVDPKDVKAYYQENMEEFPSPTRMHLWVVTVKSERDLSKVKDALGTQDLSKVAKTFSKDKYGRHGGDMGWVTFIELPDQIQNALRSLKRGEVSSPVKVSDGFKIFKILDKKEGGIKPFKEVEAQIKDSLLADKARKSALRSAAEARRLLRKGKGIEEVARRLGVKAMTTPYFPLSQGVPGVPSASKLAQALVGLKTGELSDLVRTPEGFYMVKVVDKRGSHIPPLKKVKARVMIDVRNEKGEALMNEEADKLLRASNQVGLKKALKSLGLGKMLKMKVSDYFSREDRNWGRELVSKAFSLDSGRFAEVRSGDKVFVFTLEARKSVSEKALENVSPKIREWLVKKRKDELVSQWLRELRGRIGVKVNQRLWEAI